LLKSAQPACSAAAVPTRPSQGCAAAAIGRPRIRAGASADIATPFSRATATAVRAAGQGNQRTVHHRRPGRHVSAWLITLCPACHAVVHKLQRHRRWLPASLVSLWREQHPEVPLQLQLAIETAAAGGEKVAA
jgi:hypothetical protein